MKFFKTFFNELNIKYNTIDLGMLEKSCEKIVAVNANRGKIIVVGNGGSAAIASHVAVDLTKAAGIKSICFSDAALLTCFGNDYGYENWVQKAIEFYAEKNDLLILISSSGNSSNILNAACYASTIQLPLITFSGFKPENKLRSLGEINFWVNSSDYNIVELTHNIWLCAIIDFVSLNNKK